MAQEGRKSGRFRDGTEEVIGALIEVHRHLGPGLMESAYEACVCAELFEPSKHGELARVCEVLSTGAKATGTRNEGLTSSVSDLCQSVTRVCTMPRGYRLDLVVGDRILLELKAVERLLPIHEAQVITYLRLSRLPVGLLVNFNVTVLRNGLRRLTADHPKTFRSSALPVQSE